MQLDILLVNTPLNLDWFAISGKTSSDGYIFIVNSYIAKKTMNRILYLSNLSVFRHSWRLLFVQRWFDFHIIKESISIIMIVSIIFTIYKFINNRLEAPAHEKTSKCYIYWDCYSLLQLLLHYFHYLFLNVFIVYIKINYSYAFILWFFCYGTILLLLIILFIDYILYLKVLQ